MTMVNDKLQSVPWENCFQEYQERGLEILTATGEGLEGLKEHLRGLAKTLAPRDEPQYDQPLYDEHLLASFSVDTSKREKVRTTKFKKNVENVSKHQNIKSVHLSFYQSDQNVKNWKGQLPITYGYQGQWGFRLGSVRLGWVRLG